MGTKSDNKKLKEAVELIRQATGNDDDIQKPIEYKHNEVAKQILSKHKIIYAADKYYEYQEDYYKCVKEEELKKYVKNIYDKSYNRTKAIEVLHSIQTDTFINPDKLNSTSFLNLKNGLFCLKTKQLFLHSSDDFSTIRLNINYEPTAKCPKWIETLEEIFERDSKKISVIQEFFGLCLTKNTKYAKALWLVGSGRNGKNTIVYILEEILGKANRSAVPIKKLSNPYYKAHLFGKLANISAETAANSKMCDADYKEIVSGDTICGEQKYKHPFDFKPYCKMINLSNNLPMVDDRTPSFFERLLIVRFNKQFIGDSDNKNLKYELATEELDGIFLWCLEGLNRLEERGFFTKDNVMKDEIEAYRRENNSILVFVDEECQIEPSLRSTKKEIYEKYLYWCKEAGYSPLTKRKFGTELLSQYRPRVKKARGTAGVREWVGIAMTEVT